jgi:TRAP transporter 4TM/12TM fusion protein
MMTQSVEKKKDNKGRFRQFEGIWGYLATALSISYILLYLLFIWGFFEETGREISPFQFLYLSVCAAVVYTFCYVPGSVNAPRNRLSWYDYLLIAAVLPTTLFLWFNWYDLKFMMGELSTFQLFFMIIAFISFIEAVRRTVGFTLIVVGFLALLYIFLSPYLPGILECRPHDVEEVVNALFVGDDGIYGSIMHLMVFTITSLFIFGAFIRVLGADKFFTDFAMALAGKQAGGGAKVAVIGSGLFGMLSGSGVANAATTGMVTIPMMKKSGQRPEFAAAVEAVASTGGTFMPPVMGVIAFIMADFLGISYWSVCVHAFVPAVLFFFIAYLQIHFEAKRMGLDPLSSENLPRIFDVMKRGWVVLVPIVTLIYFLGAKGWSIQSSCLYSVVALVAICFIYKETRPTLRKIIMSLEASARAILTFIPIIIMVGVILVSLNITGLGIRLTHTIAAVGADNLLLLLLLSLAGAFIMGMAVSGVATYILLAIFIAPPVAASIAHMEVVPMSVHLFLMYIASTSMITPPVCLAVYTTCSIADSTLWKTGMEAVRLGLGMFILPFAFVADNSLLLFGDPIKIFLSLVFAIIACILLAAGAMGYFFFTRLNVINRIIFFTAGIAMLFPVLQAKLIAFVIISAIVVLNFLLKKNHNQIHAIKANE